MTWSQIETGNCPALRYYLTLFRATPESVYQWFAILLSFWETVFGTHVIKKIFYYFFDPEKTETLSLSHVLSVITSVWEIHSSITSTCGIFESLKWLVWILPSKFNSLIPCSVLNAQFISKHLEWLFLVPPCAWINIFSLYMVTMQLVNVFSLMPTVISRWKSSHSNCCLCEKCRILPCPLHVD